MNSILPIGQLLEAVGQIEGRKRLQKMVHILQHFGAPFGLKFGYLHFGPYSSELQSQLEVFEEEDLIEETPVVGGLYPTSKFEAKGPLKELVERIAGNATPNWKPLAVQLNKKSVRELEAISTLIFLRASGKSGEALRQSFTDLKPKLASDFEIRLGDVESLEAEFGNLRAVATA